MFGDMFGDMEARQEEMQKKLKEITLEAEAGDGAVKVSADGTGELINISIDPGLMAEGDSEALEDLLLVAINRVLEDAKAREAEEAQNLLKDMLPPGMGDFGDMFG